MIRNAHIFLSPHKHNTHTRQYLIHRATVELFQQFIQPRWEFSSLIVVITIVTNSAIYIFQITTRTIFKWLKSLSKVPPPHSSNWMLSTINFTFLRVLVVIIVYCSSLIYNIQFFILILCLFKSIYSLSDLSQSSSVCEK